MAVHRDLVALARDGDHDAFSSVAASSIKRLYSIARFILGDPDAAEDAVQDTLILAWRDLRGLRDIGRFDAWLHRLLVRSCYRRAKQDRRRHVVELEVLRLEDPEASTVDRPIIERDRVGRALSRLPRDQRVVLVLHHHLSLELTEVAELRSELMIVSAMS